MARRRDKPRPQPPQPPSPPRHAHVPPERRTRVTIDDRPSGGPHGLERFEDIGPRRPERAP